jgi:hypothetical protein
MSANGYGSTKTNSDRFTKNWWEDLSRQLTSKKNFSDRGTPPKESDYYEKTWGKKRRK